MAYRVVGLAVLLMGGGLVEAAGVRWEHLSSTRGTLPVPGTSTQQTAAVVADLARDGVSGFVLGFRQKAPALVWYRRSKDGWDRYVIEKEYLTIEAGGAAHDIDGDGYLDLVFGGDWQSNCVWWWRNPGKDWKPAVSWERHTIKKSGKTQHHDQCFADFRGAGKAQLAYWNQGAKTLFVADIPANPRQVDQWPAQQVFSGSAGERPGKYAEGMSACDIDGDGRPELLAGNHLFKSMAEGKWKATKIGDIGGLIFAGRFVKEARHPQIVIAPGDASGPVKWYECKADPLESKSWVGHDLVGREMIHPHSLQVADIDGDGNLDIFVAEMAQWSNHKVDNPEAQALIFYGDGKGSFRKTIFQTGMGFHEARVADLDGDGRLDILSKPYRWDTPRVDVWLNRGPAADAPEPVARLIRQAGNADDDAKRLSLLRQLQALPGLEPSLKADADAMVAAVEQWVHGRELTYFGGQIGRTMDYDFKLKADSSLYPLTRIYRGRMLVWLVLESGGLINNADRRRPYLDKAVAEFRAYAAAFPESRIARMYLGEPILNPRRYPGVDGAPQWAALQRENLERLADIVVWWIDHRMQPDCQYGGGWGDDCEMWRFWVPVLVAFDDPKITAAQARFSAALMSQPHMQAGYTRQMSDVEHTAEDSADVITPMMHLEPDNPLWKARALKMADLMENLWTGRNQRGQLQFKSTYFTCDRVDATPQRACDTVYHPRAVQPTLLLWQRTGDPRLGRLFADWMGTWVDAAARAERGKPAGVVPSAIHWPDGSVGGTSPDWWDPRNHGETTLYRWPSAMPMMCNTLLLTWRMTKDEKYLAPIRSMAEIRRQGLRRQDRQPATEGTAAWCAAHMSFLNTTLAKYRKLSGSTEFDDLLSPADRGEPAAGDRRHLIQRLRASAEAMRINFEGYTSEVRYTDRVLRFPALFGRDMLFAERTARTPHAPREEIRYAERDEYGSPDPSLLYSSATGDPGDAGYMPLAAVRWLTPPRELAALVTQSGPRRLQAELFHFGPGARPMGAELYLLEPGNYRFRIQASAGAAGPAGNFRVTGQRTRISFTLPPQTLCVLEVDAT